MVTADLICHGVTPQPLWSAFAHDAMRRAGVGRYLSRAKADCDDLPPKDTYVGRLNNAEGEGLHADDWLMNYFLRGVGYSPACYACRYAGSERVGDITLGDLSGLPAADWRGGASVVLLNTPKGAALRPLFEAAGRTCPVTSTAQAQGGDGGQLRHPSKRDPRTTPLHLLHKLFALGGPRALFALDRLWMRLLAWLRGMTFVRLAHSCGDAANFANNSAEKCNFAAW